MTRTKSGLPLIVPKRPRPAARRAENARNTPPNALAAAKSRGGYIGSNTRGRRYARYTIAA